MDNFYNACYYSSCYLGEVGGLASLVLGDLVHRMLGALLALAEGAPLLRYVHHLSVSSRPRGRPTKAYNQCHRRDLFLV